MTSVAIKGWCPGALRPMMSGDGLIVRVRPRLAQLTKDQVIGLCYAAQHFGSGIIDLTSRANLQIRGVAEHNHDQLLQRLAELGLLDADAETEARRNIVCTPLWDVGDLTNRLHDAIVARLPDMPALPGKMGIAIDTGPGPHLSQVSADFRFERGKDVPLIMRADGAERGRLVEENDAVDALHETMTWFLKTGGRTSKRMAPHLKTTDLPSEWTSHVPAAPQPRVEPGLSPLGPVLGAPFGQIDATRLLALVEEGQARAIRVTPWRLFLAEGARIENPHSFVTDPDDRLLNVHACPGRPYCPAATVETRRVAMQLAGRTDEVLHVSGCTKGCAHPGEAAMTLVGRDGAYDLVRDGSPCDTPQHRGIQAEDLPAFLDG